MKSKYPKESAVETRHIVMPQHTNHYGTVFGGTIMSWIDLVAAMVAERHCGHEVVTASIDTISFKAPIYIGEHVVLKASVNYVGNTSMEVGVQVSKENPYTNQSEITTIAYLTFVGLDENRKPVKIPDLIPETNDEIRRYKNSEIRVNARRELLKQIRKKEENLDIEKH